MADDDDYDMFDNTTYAPCSVGRALEEWCDAVPSSMLSGSYWLEGSSLLYSAFMAVLLVVRCMHNESETFSLLIDSTAKMTLARPATTGRVHPAAPPCPHPSPPP